MTPELERKFRETLELWWQAKLQGWYPGWSKDKDKEASMSCHERCMYCLELYDSENPAGCGCKADREIKELRSRNKRLEDALKVSLREAEGILKFSPNADDRNCAEVIRFHAEKAISGEGLPGIDITVISTGTMAQQTPIYVNGKRI